jgi:hypothetical protein
VPNNSLEILLKSQRLSALGRDEQVRYYLNHPQELKMVLELCYSNDQHTAFQAAWILDGVLRKNDELLIPIWEQFTSQLSKTTNPSVLRSFAKICELVCTARWKSRSQAWIETINDTHCELLTQNLFDWLIGPQKVAVKVFAMTSLYYLGEAVPWINGELAAVIESQLPGSSAGFKNRGQKTLAALHKRMRA